jgi:Tfp pilus assembly protein PilF
LDPQNYDVRYERAKLFEEQGHLAEALHEITLGLPHAVKWKREYGYSKRAKLHLQMGQVDEALQDVTSAFNEHDEGISAGDLHRLRAEIYEKLGRKVDAEKDRQAAAKLP